MPRARWSLLLLFFAAGLDAQTPERPSHRPLDNGFGDDVNPEDVLAQRLAGSRKALETDKELRELAKRFLSDDKFLRSLEDSFSKDDMKKLAERFGDKKSMADLANDPTIKRLLDEVKRSGQLDDGQRGLIEKWTKTNPTPEPPKFDPPPPNVVPPTPAPQPKQEVPAWLRDKMERWTADAEKWAKTPDAAGWRDFLRRMAENRKGGENMVGGALERTRGLGRYLPRVGDYLPRNVAPPRLPSLPSLPHASLPSGADARSFARTLLLLLGVVAVAVLLWRSAGWVQALAGAGGGWRLGPWPVAIDAVRTREQLVRAFEYLSLLRLGRAARTRHHNALAAEIGRQPDPRPDERRASADTLAALYEQARYAPPAEDLSDAQLEQARRELHRLAGGAA